MTLAGNDERATIGWQKRRRLAVMVGPTATSSINDTGLFIFQAALWRE
jgi:hypothetical protein